MWLYAAPSKWEIASLKGGKKIIAFALSVGIIIGSPRQLTRESVSKSLNLVKLMLIFIEFGQKYVQHYYAAWPGRVDPV